MTEYELDKIKKSFVRSNAKCPVEVACLLTVIKYYNGKETDIHTLTEWCKINGKLTLAGMKQGAIYSGMKAEICLQNIHQLTQRKLPIILFTLNDFNVPGYVVCYGIHESRFIIWGTGIRTHAILGGRNENIMDKRNSPDPLSHTRFYEFGKSPSKMVGNI